MEGTLYNLLCNFFSPPSWLQYVEIEVKYCLYLIKYVVTKRVYLP